MLVLSEQDAGNRRDKIKAASPVYTGNFKKGIYYTVEEFLANTPSDTAIIVTQQYISERRILYYYHHLNDKGKAGKTIRGDAFFALYDGKRWHAGGEMGTRKMLFENGEFIALRAGQGIVTPYRSSEVQMMGMAGGGGAVGHLMASGITALHNNRKKMVKAFYKSRFDPGKKEFVAIEREIIYQ